MEGILESTTHRTLHAHNFSRSSSQASLVLTDLLSRYLALLTSSCAKYAQHAGRLNLSMKDALSALEDIGVNLDELSEYCKSEGRELARYAVQTARRVEDLREIKASLVDGLKQDDTDVIHLVYAPIPEFSSDDEDESQVTASEHDHEESMIIEQSLEAEQSGSRVQMLDVPLPTFPPSPISNPSSPTCKRARTPKWEPPTHVPDFLPPFPISKDDTALTPPEQPTPHELPLQRHPPVGKSDKALSPLPQVSTSTSSSDYLTPVPYSQSSLSSLPTWHLPSPPSAASTSAIQPPASRLPIPQTQPALLGAYHHILTHPASRNTNSANPSRHRIALSLLSQTETNSRWEPADTLFSISAPNAPRVSSMAPSHAVPLKPVSTPAPGTDSKGDKPEHESNRLLLPSMSPHPITYTERITPLMSQQASRIPEVARAVLSPSVYLRATRLSHPPVLKRGSQILVYGPGVPAPWNAITAPQPPSQPAVKREDKSASGMPNGKAKEEPQPILPDARFYATWDYEQKNFKEPLAVGRKRAGGIQSSGSLSRGRNG